MAWQRIRLVAFDLDGTALENERIPRRCRKLLAQFVREGGVVTTASGRALAPQQEILRRSWISPRKGYPQFLITCDKFIYELRDEAYEPLEEWNDGLRQRWANVLPVILQRLPGVTAAFAREGIAHEFVGSESFWRDVGYVAMLFEDSEQAIEAGKLLQRSLGDMDGIYINRNLATGAVTCTGFSKGDALVHLSQVRGLSPDEVLAVGDAFNDLSMLDGRFGFRSAAVANAMSEIKDAVGGNSGYLSPQPAAGGLRDILRKLLAERHQGRGPA